MQITTSILQATADSDRGGIKITSLMRSANIPHPRLSKFIDKLTSNGLINKIEQKGKYTYVITEAGILLLEKYKQFDEFASNFGLEL